MAVSQHPSLLIKLCFHFKAAPLKSEVLHCDLNTAIDCQLLERPNKERSFETQSLHLSFGLCCGRFADEISPKSICLGSLLSSIL